MDTDIIVTCPRCGESFPLTAALSHQVRDQLLAPERERLQAEVERATDHKWAGEIATLREELQEGQKREAEYRQRDIDVRRQERELARREKERDLELERARAEIEKVAEDHVAQRFQAQINQKDSQLLRVSAELEKLRQKASTGSAQLAGIEAQKLLGTRLQEMFPDDQVEVVRQGQHGADVKQEVCTGGGRQLGTILWEHKNAANWSAAWVDKIQNDCDEARANVGVIVSRALPRDASGMTLVKDIVVVAPEYVHHVAPLLRLQVQQEARHRIVAGANDGTADRVLKYLTTGGFVPRMVRAVEAIANLQDGIAKERRVAERRWLEQQKQAECVIRELTGVAVDLDAEGAHLPTIPALEPAALPE